MAAAESKLFESVLLVEDEPSHAILIKRGLRDLVGDIQTASSLAEAERALKQEIPEFIITDLHLPDTKGVTHIEVLRTLSRDVPVLVLTSSTSLSEAVEAMKLGARDFIVKSFDAHFHEVLHLSISRLYAATRIEEERQRLQRETILLRESIERENDGFAILNRDLDVSYANGSFKQFAAACGWDGAKFLTICTSNIKGHAALEQQIRDKVTSLGAGGVWHSEVNFLGDQIVAFDMSLSIVDHSDDGGPRDSRIVVWVKDISELKRREKFQREILSTTTHDLKGPLGAISISAELLCDLLPKGERPYELAVRVGSSAQNAINLIEEFLSARRIQEGSLILRPSAHPLRTLVEQVTADFSAIAAAKKIKMEINVPDIELNVDKLGFARVLGNLLSNACKFSPAAGHITVTAKLSHDEVEIEVADSGSGMEASEVLRVFERFSRLDRHRDVSGTGLGLFVVKSIVSAHGGKVEVTSEVGKGTKFVVRFPSHPPVNERGELISLDFA